MRSQCQSEAISIATWSSSVAAAHVTRRLSLSGNTLSSTASITPLVHIEFFSSLNRDGEMCLPSNVHSCILIRTV